MTSPKVIYRYLPSCGTYGFECRSSDADQVQVRGFGLTVEEAKIDWSDRRNPKPDTHTDDPWLEFTLVTVCLSTFSVVAYIVAVMLFGWFLNLN